MWTACSGYIGKPPADIDPSIPSSDSSALRMQFPMWLMPGKILATLQPPLLPHEELLQEGKLVRWEPGHPNTVVFISHEWIGSHHPDPAFKQFRVLQQALQNLMAGAVTIRKDTVSEFLNIPLATLSDSMQRRCLDWDFWYDFMSCPQLGVSGGPGASIEEKSASKRGLAAAIASIPAYCEKADLTVVLAPSVLHSDVHQVLSTSSWSSRGWCRAERTATVFSSASSASKKVLLVVSGPTQISISGGPEWISAWPGQGKFTIEHDRTVLQDLTGELLATKCENLLRSGQSQWRFYQALLPKARGRADFEREGLDHFLQRYSIPDSHCVVHGMTPLMLASLEGNVSVMRELLESKADVDELIAWRLPEGHIQGKSVTALLLAASLSSKEAVATLLDARASLDLPSGVSGSGIVVQAAYFGNSDVLATLIERRGDMDCPTFLGGNALLAAAGSPSVDSTRILLATGERRCTWRP